MTENKNTVEEKESHTVSANIRLIKEQYLNLNSMLGSVITISTSTQKEMGNIRKDLNEFKSDIKEELKIIAENISFKSRSSHENTCSARNDMQKIIAKTSENTGVIKTIRDGSKRMPNWIKITTGVTALVTAVATLLAVIF